MAWVEGREQIGGRGEGEHGVVDVMLPAVR